MKIKMFIKWTDFDKDGNIIGETEHEANSLVNGFVASLLNQMSQTNLANVKDTSGTNRLMGISNYVFRTTAAAADATFGILFGRGTTAVSSDDYSLVTPITEGTGANQLNHSLVTFDSGLTTSGSNIYFQIYRTATNNTGSTITIEEVGLVEKSGSNYLFLIDRTLSTKAILAGNGTTCTYKIQI